MGLAAVRTKRDVSLRVRDMATRRAASSWEGGWNCVAGAAGEGRRGCLGVWPIEGTGEGEVAGRTLATLGKVDTRLERKEEDREAEREAEPVCRASTVA